MNWYFLRHAKTERPTPSVSDYNRKLTQKGIQQVEALDAYLSPYPIDRVICSSALRTRQTHAGLHCLQGLETRFTQDLYLATLSQWKGIVPQHACDHCLFIGHNDGISDFLTWLTGEDLSLQTAGFIHVSFMGDDPLALAQGTAVLRHRYRPQVMSED